MGVIDRGMAGSGGVVQDDGEGQAGQDVDISTYTSISVTGEKRCTSEQEGQIPGEHVPEALAGCKLV